MKILQTLLTVDTDGVNLGIMHMYYADLQILYKNNVNNHRHLIVFYTDRCGTEVGQKWDRGGTDVGRYFATVRSTDSGDVFSAC